MALGGFLEPVYGLAGLCLIAVISILKILFKNFLLIVGMIVLDWSVLLFLFTSNLYSYTNILLRG